MEPVAAVMAAFDASTPHRVNCSIEGGFAGDKESKTHRLGWVDGSQEHGIRSMPDRKSFPGLQRRYSGVTVTSSRHTDSKCSAESVFRSSAKRSRCST
jgi:hypothetical protein